MPQAVLFCFWPIYWLKKGVHILALGLFSTWMLGCAPIIFFSDPGLISLSKKKKTMICFAHHLILLLVAYILALPTTGLTSKEGFNQ